MKRIISFVLIICVSFIFLASCGEENRKYNEAEVIEAAEKLIPISKKLNDIFWGEGIRYIEDDNYSDGSYYPADVIHLQALGYDSVNEILSATDKVFSDGIYNIITSTIFSRTESNLARYYQLDDVIMVYKNFTPELYDEVEYLCDTISVLGSEGQRVNISIDVKITEKETGATQIREKKFALIEEEDGWRLDSFTYAKYQTTKN